VSYVQRAVIALTEKGVAFERIDIDLGNKPDCSWRFLRSGKTRSGWRTAIFESAVFSIPGKKRS